MISTIITYTLSDAEARRYKRLLAQIEEASNAYAADTRNLEAIGRCWDLADDLRDFELALRDRLGADDMGYLERRESEVVYVYRSRG